MVVVVALMVTALGVVVALAAVLYTRQRRKNHVYEYPDLGSGEILAPSNYCEPVSLRTSPAHLPHQPHPLHTQVNITDNALLDSGDHIVMQVCPAYVSVEDTCTSGDYAYIDRDYVYI